MRLKHFVIHLVLLTLPFSNLLSQDISCPKILDQNIVLFQPTQSKVFCEYDEFGKCFQSFDRTPYLMEQLEYFDTRFRDNGIEIFWKSKTININDTYTLLRSKDGKQFFELKKLYAKDFQNGEYVFLDNLPEMGNNFYLLKKEENEKTIISHTQTVYSATGVCHLETIAVKNKSEENISAKYYTDAAGAFQILITDTNGNEHLRKSVSLKNGKNEIDFKMPMNGMYFVTLTNGFSSVTDLFVQSKGKDEDQYKSVSKSPEDTKKFD